jgi:hypothetical protein
MKIPNFIINGLMYFATGLLILGVFLIFMSGKVHNSFFGDFLVYGILSTCTGSLILWIQIRSERNKIEDVYTTWKNDLIRSGLQVQVNFEDCSMTSNSFREERIYTSSKEKDLEIAMDAIAGNRHDAFYDRHNSRIILEASIYNHNYKFMSPVITKDEITMLFLLAEKKTTTIYVNPRDYSDYYFDLEFLENS